MQNGRHSMAWWGAACLFQRGPMYEVAGEGSMRLVTSEGPDRQSWGPPAPDAGLPQVPLQELV